MHHRFGCEYLSKFEGDTFCIPPKTTILVPWMVALCPAIDGGEVTVLIAVHLLVSMQYSCSSLNRVYA